MRRFSGKYHSGHPRREWPQIIKKCPAFRPPAAIVGRLPSGLDDYVGRLLQRYPVEVQLVRRRVSKLGDHRPPSDGFPWHRITLNEDLNPYALGVTLLHEMAHLVTYLEHGSRRRLRPHGQEWQQQYATILRPVLEKALLPKDLAGAISAAGDRPRAATCSDRKLLLALSQYDSTTDPRCRVEDLPLGSVFETETGRRFILGPRLRSRYRCHEAHSGAEYRVHGLARVARVAPDGLAERTVREEERVGR